MLGGRSKNWAACRWGFTLLEVLVALVLVGVAIASLLACSRALTQTNAAAAELSTAEFLIEQIHELTMGLAVVDPQSGTATFGPEETALADYDDVDDFDGAVFCPPISERRVAINNLSAFSQRVTVENVSASDFGQVVADHGSAFVRTTVSVMLNGRQISSLSWLRAAY
jgi:prepilin-type N-terminal cleavage/methylation domain-containing protein